VQFTLTAGQKGDAPQSAALIEGLPAEVVMADTAYDADQLRQAIAAKGALAVIPNNPARALKYPLDKHRYAQRDLVECCFSKLKKARRVATRFERPPEITVPSSLSLPSSYGCDKCPHHLAVRLGGSNLLSPPSGRSPHGQRPHGRDTAWLLPGLSRSFGDSVSNCERRSTFPQKF
jgi:transposase